MTGTQLRQSFSEDGVRSHTALGRPAARYWRLGALVFRPDLLRISHKVLSPAGETRIVVWAIRERARFGSRPEERPSRTGLAAPSQDSLRLWIYRFKKDNGRDWPAGRRGAARPAVDPALGGAPVASPQSRILRESHSQNALRNQGWQMVSHRLNAMAPRRRSQPRP